MAEFSDWIGRTREEQDEVTRPALRRIAAMLDGEQSEFPAGMPLPPHWYAMFFPEIAAQSQLGTDGHPKRGDFLPPVALPRRMFAGRRVRFHAPLRVGDVATKCSTITAITPKQGRSGAMVFITIRHEISVGGAARVTEEQDVVYRQAALPGAAPAPATPTPPPAEAAWSKQMTASPTLLFRYSAITFNAHRIHYDADYARDTEAYPGLVVNGGLTLLMLLEEAIGRVGRPPLALSVRNLRPLFADQPMALAGTLDQQETAAAWVLDSTGNTAISVKINF